MGRLLKEFPLETRLQTEFLGKESRGWGLGVRELDPLKSGTEKSLPIAKNHPKPSQEFSEQIGPSIHKTNGF